MKKLDVLEPNVLKAYAMADEKGKAMLTEMFGKELFNQKITDRVKTFEDALEIVGCSANIKMILDFNGQEKDMLAQVALAKLTIIAKALNEGWQPDWTDGNERKYFAWLDGSSGRWSYYDCDSWSTYSTVGSRLSFKSSELAEYAGKQFTSLYSDLFTI